MTREETPVDLDELARETASRWASISGDITQMQSLLHSRPHLTEDEKDRHERTNQIRDAKLSAIVERNEGSEHATTVSIVEAYRVDVEYATYLAGELKVYFERSDNPSGNVIFDKRLANYSSDFADANTRLAELGVTAESQKQTQPDLDDEEAKKRRAGQTVSMGNPADAQLGANIRPEVGSGPAGLETYTTQKSAVYEAFPNTERKTEAPEQAFEDEFEPEYPSTMTVREVYLLTLRNRDPEERIADAVAWQKSPDFKETAHAFPPVEEALEALLSQDDAVRYRESATFAELWPVLDALPNEPSPLWGAERESSIAGAEEQPPDRFEIATAQLADQQRIEDQQQGDGETPPEAAEPRKMTPQERQDARREAREAAELEQRHGRDERAAKLKRSERHLSQDEGQDRGGGISI